MRNIECLGGGGGGTSGWNSNFLRTPVDFVQKGGFWGCCVAIVIKTQKTVKIHTNQIINNSKNIYIEQNQNINTNQTKKHVIINTNQTKTISIRKYKFNIFHLIDQILNISLFQTIFCYYLLTNTNDNIYYLLTNAYFHLHDCNGS